MQRIRFGAMMWLTCVAIGWVAACSSEESKPVGLFPEGGIQLSPGAQCKTTTPEVAVLCAPQDGKSLVGNEIEIEVVEQCYDCHSKLSCSASIGGKSAVRLVVSERTCLAEGERPCPQCYRHTVKCSVPALGPGNYDIEIQKGGTFYPYLPTKLVVTADGRQTTCATSDADASTDASADADADSE